MDQSNQSPGKLFNPFKDHPEEEIQKRLEHSKRLSREEFAQRIEETKKQLGDNPSAKHSEKHQK